ncbi:hypothetical protein M5D96_010340, partial [Drosophila gunungcola]
MRFNKNNLAIKSPSQSSSGRMAINKCHNAIKTKTKQKAYMYLSGTTQRRHATA